MCARVYRCFLYECHLYVAKQIAISLRKDSAKERIDLFALIRTKNLLITQCIISSLIMINCSAMAM